MRTLLTLAVALAAISPSWAADADAHARAALALADLMPSGKELQQTRYQQSPEEKILAELRANAARIEKNQATLQANAARIEKNLKFLEDNAERIEANTSILEANAERMEKAILRTEELQKILTGQLSRMGVPGSQQSRANTLRNPGLAAPKNGCSCGANCQCPTGGNACPYECPSNGGGP